MHKGIGAGCLEELGASDMQKLCQTTGSELRQGSLGGWLGSAFGAHVKNGDECRFGSGAVTGAWTNRQQVFECRTGSVKGEVVMDVPSWTQKLCCSFVM